MEARLANPRGFCAGVDRAIDIVHRALEIFGAPIYVRHEVVHNRFVVASLEAKGAVFVEQLADVPNGVPTVFSAHGVPKWVPAEARETVEDEIESCDFWIPDAAGLSPTDVSAERAGGAQQRQAATVIMKSGAKRRGIIR